MIITIEPLDGEELPSRFAEFISGAAPFYEKRFKERVPTIELRLIRGGKAYYMVGGFWMEDPQGGQ